MGRYLVANRDIEQGEVIIFEEPLVIGPKQATYPVCLSCYRRVDGSYLCTDCGWPLCDQQCQTDNCDHRAECQFLAAQHVSVQINTQEEDCRVYDCVAPLRTLLAMSELSERRDLLSSMETHHSHRRDIGIWDVDHVAVVDVIRHDWDLQEYFSQQDIQTACAVLEVNAFEVNHDGVNARSIYSVACLMAHDCVPNTVCNIDAQNRMSVKAAVAISCGSMITTSYTFTLDSTQRRRKHLKETKFFDCLCQRCCDASELSTHLSSLTCPKCCQGVVVPQQPLDDTSDWTCLNDCNFRMSAQQVDRILDNLQRKADSLNYDDVAGLESFIDKWSKLLHPNNSIVVGVKYYLCLLYGNVDDYLVDQMPDALVQRKIALCKELLDIAHILEPGSSKLNENLQSELKLAEAAQNDRLAANQQNQLEKTST